MQQRDPMASWSHRQFEIGDAAAGIAGEHRFAQPELAEGGVGSGAGAAQVRAGAVRAQVGSHQSALQALKLLLRLRKPLLVLIQGRLQLRVLRLQIAALAFQRRLLRLDEGRLLAKKRRTAVLVDEFLDQFQWSHGIPVGWKRPGGRVLTFAEASALAREEDRAAA